MSPERFSLLLLTSLFMFRVQANNQDSLFNLPKRMAYADHLVRKGRFADAGREWYSIWVLDHRDSSAVQSMKMFRMAALPDSAIHYDSAMGHAAMAAKERAYALALSGRFSGALALSPTDSVRLALVSCCISGQLEDARKLIHRYQQLLIAVKDEGLTNLIKRMEKTKNIPVGMCVSASAVVPGSGRLIIGRYADAALSFSVTLTNAVLAGYTYRNLGARSLWPWLYGGLAAGFYGANIYGTYRDSRHEYTYRKRKLSHEAFRYLHNHLLVHTED